MSENCATETLDVARQAEAPDPILDRTPAELHDEISRLAGAVFDQTAKLDVAVIECGRLRAELALGGNMLRAAHKEIADLTLKETELLAARKAIVALKLVIEPFADAWRNGIRFHGETSMKQYIGAEDFKAAFDIIEGTGTIAVPSGTLEELMQRNSDLSYMAALRIEANARLIAAAPDLLAALQELVAAMEPHLDGWDRAQSARWTKCVAVTMGSYRSAVAAIARATGAA